MFLESACWEFHPGQWTYSYSSIGDKLFSDIHEAISFCTQLGIEDCGAVLYDDINGIHLRKEANLQGESNSTSSMGSWTRKSSLNSQC